MSLDDVLLLITGTMTALLAGVFFGFAVSVNGGLHRLKDAEYVRAMQSINVVILNPLFLLCFMGPVVLLPVVTFLFWGEGAQSALLLAASLFYIIGTFGITSVGNVPLNDKLAKVDTENLSSAELGAARAQFEQPWNRLHIIRTVAANAATVVLFAACLA